MNTETTTVPGSVNDYNGSLPSIISAQTTKELKPGDKLYGFDTQGRQKNIKNSAYWLDEGGYKNVKSKYYKNGKWDKEGVKNYLALPCYNRATDELYKIGLR